LQHELQSTVAQRSRIGMAGHCKGGFMKWETPSFTDMRFGFEITMYIATR
jgi:pyrroloquinoline quinone biosynthesis protein A